MATSRPLVLGLTGGIGAGKSAVARALASLGFVVSDSDTEAKAALDRDDVRSELVRWWGPSILSATGKVDRKAVASIIFANAAERTRLERLVHPLLRETRAALLTQIESRGTRGLVIDAPLLLEAGLADECDAIIFVDAPRETRLARVRATRGWDEAEFDRRERAQWAVERKRAASSHVLVNDADESALAERVARVVDEIEHRRS